MQEKFHLQQLPKQYEVTTLQEQPLQRPCLHASIQRPNIPFVYLQRVVSVVSIKTGQHNSMFRQTSLLLQQRLLVLFQVAQNLFLDLHATVEALETIGVPTLGFQCNHFPPFIEQSAKDDPNNLPRRVSSCDIATICNTHWHTLGLPSAVLVTVPAPMGVAIERGSLAEILQIADTAWLESKQPPASRTPFYAGETSCINTWKNACRQPRVALQ